MIMYNKITYICIRLFGSSKVYAFSQFNQKPFLFIYKYPAKKMKKKRIINI